MYKFCLLYRLHQFICLFLLISPLSVSLGYAKKLPVEYFANLPDVSQVQLSPDGKHIASLVRVKGDDTQGVALTIVNLNTLKKELVLYASNEKYVVRWINWANNEKILISASFPAERYGTPTKERRLIVTDIHTKKVRSILTNRNFRMFNYVPQLQDKVIDFLEDDDKHFLLELDGHSPNEPTVYKVALNKNKLKTVQASRRHVTSWMTDQQRRVRIGYHFKDKHYKIIHRHPDDKKKWKTLWEFDAFAADQVWPIGFGKDPTQLYVNALHEGRDAIFLVDVTDPQLKKTLIHANENYDVNGSLVYSKVTKKVIGITAPDDGGYIFWDKEYKGLFNGINKVLPEKDNYLISMSDDERKYIVLSTSGTDSGTYYVGDRDKKTLDAIALRYRDLDPKVMVAKKHITYKARDGLKIHAYLSLPKNRKQNEKMPTIIFPHGGPISHDGKGFDYWTQFFANRGYAVLQMNFRGSSGYGHDFMQAGLKNWGLAMQDDVADGANWMIEKGYADPSKMCIVGASYGGYAALMGAIKTPELYTCAVSFAGVSDVSYLVKSSRRYTNYEVVKELVGTKHRELKQRSPYYHAEKINIPVLLIHGNKDRIVRVKHSQKMYKALKKKNKDVTYVELDNGSHYLSKGPMRLKTFEAMNAFLEQHLGN